MRQGEASVTAQRVASHRLGFARLPAPYGRPQADEQLARDVAGQAAAASSEGMVRYLAARTAFFDRVVVGVLERGVTQVVIAAAGYDGRALRYAKPGVRFFEVDHPDTQADKRARLERLAIDTSHIAFAPADFTLDDVGAALIAAGLEPTVASLVLCEGVAVYLDRPVLESLLRQIRAVAAKGSRLAISLSVDSDSPGQAERRARFQAAVAAAGEPARTVLTASDADALFAATGWQAVPAGTAANNDPDRARAAGLVVVEPA